MNSPKVFELKMPECSLHKCSTSNIKRIAIEKKQTPVVYNGCKNSIQHNSDESIAALIKPDLHLLAGG